jgi:hypothetical protein
MQQRAKNDVPRQPKKVHWDHLLDEAEWLRRDFREERVWKMDEAKTRAGECVREWTLRAKDRGRFVDEGEVAGSGLAYRREGEQDEDVGWGRDFAVRTGVADNDVEDRLKRPRTLRRFSHFDGSI